MTHSEVRGIVLLFVCSVSFLKCCFFGLDKLLNFWTGLFTLTDNHDRKGPIALLAHQNDRRQSIASQRVSVQCSSVAQSCPTLFNPMNHSTPGLRVHHQLSEFTQTHIHRVSDAMQPSHPLSSPSPPAPNPSQHQRLFQWVNSSHEVAKVLEFQLYHHSFQRNPRADLQNGLVGTSCSSRDSQESSPISQFKRSILQRSAFFTVQLSHWYKTIGKTKAWLDGPLLAK